MERVLKDTLPYRVELVQCGAKARKVEARQRTKSSRHACVKGLKLTGGARVGLAAPTTVSDTSRMSSVEERQSNMSSH